MNAERNFFVYINTRCHVWGEGKKVVDSAMRESENEELVEAELSNLDVWRLKIDTMYVKKKFISFTHPKNSCHLHLLRISSRNHFETLLIYIRCFIAWRGLSVVNETCIKNPTLDKNQTKPPTFSSTFISFHLFLLLGSLVVVVVIVDHDEDDDGNVIKISYFFHSFHLKNFNETLYCTRIWWQLRLLSTVFLQCELRW